MVQYGWTTCWSLYQDRIKHTGITSLFAVLPTRIGKDYIYQRSTQFYHTPFSALICCCLPNWVWKPFGLQPMITPSEIENGPKGSRPIRFTEMFWTWSYTPVRAQGDSLYRLWTSGTERDSLLQSLRSTVCNSLWSHKGRFVTVFVCWWRRYSPAIQQCEYHSYPVGLFLAAEGLNMFVLLRQRAVS